MSRGLSAIPGHSDSTNGSGMAILRYENLQIAKRFHNFRAEVAQVGHIYVCVRFRRAVQLAEHCTRITLWSIEDRTRRCFTSHSCFCTSIMLMIHVTFIVLLIVVLLHIVLYYLAFAYHKV